MTSKHKVRAQKAEKALIMRQLVTKPAQLSAAVERETCIFESAQNANRTEYDLKNPDRLAVPPKTIHGRCQRVAKLTTSTPPCETDHVIFEFDDNPSISL